jgi:opacity protein-like surface antigen
MIASRLVRAALVSAVAVSPALGQDTVFHQHVPNEFERRSSGNITFIQSRPVGDFQKNIGLGYGANLTYLFRLDREGFLSLRGDAGIAVYGGEHFYAPLSPTVGGRIQVKVSTTNNVIPLSFGPQISWPYGPLRPYLNAGLGAHYFFTESSIQGTDDEYEFANTTNQSDWTSAWVFGGGLYAPIYEGKTKVSLDLGVQYYKGGRAQYLRPGSITDLPNAQIAIQPLESDTHMLLVRLGVRIGI